MRVRLFLAAAALGALLAAPGARAEEASGPDAPPDARFVIGPGNEAYAAALPGKYAAGIAGYRLRGTAIARDRIVYDYAGAPDGGFSVVLRHPKDSASSRRSKYFAIEFDFHLHLGVVALGKAGVNRQVLYRDPIRGD